uniref:Uncharacterized protein n=1 Tax=Anguilla anguilla TaxID=7936 RepID=A0A0E9WKV0_ANGAN
MIVFLFTLQKIAVFKCFNRVMRLKIVFLYLACFKLRF